MAWHGNGLLSESVNYHVYIIEPFLILRSRLEIYSEVLLGMV